MTLGKMLEAGKLIEVGGNYMTDGNVVIIRCYGAGTSLYWVREDDLFTVYTNLDDAYDRRTYCGKSLMSMRARTRDAIMSGLKAYLKGAKA